jgi:hypothetical protein
MILGPGQGGDSPMFPVVMDAVRVPRLSGGRARTRTDAVMGDKAYSSRANRALLRGRGIKAVIPEHLATPIGRHALDRPFAAAPPRTTADV